MNNHEIREAVLRIAYIKSLGEEAQKLREKIIREMKKRRKDKLDLGGPVKEDYVCLRESERTDIDPEALLVYLTDKADDFGGDKKVAMRMFLKSVRVVQKDLTDVIGEEEAEHVRSTLKQIYRYTRETLTYKVSTDDKNQFRGIDL